eukprot:CAMPEP_0178399196 /NCGR_PEP_ID=MMETSP0689_2-20121128/15158_1 /TAXON_ID=160604 /ORGANISM="Amphidinium massartii, Strain CS-259" /LENGTH=128 /DNA_ID=CAMNT_0020019971 /DNA_START=101 /DNA_END=487 /DNA_ORIENTATION=-
MARSAILPTVILAACAMVLLCSVSGFVSPSALPKQASRADSLVSMSAQKKAGLAKRKLYTGGAGQFVTYEEPLGTGAQNKVSIITPPISSEGTQGFWSMAPFSLGAWALLTVDGIIRLQYVIPDAMYW